MLIELKFSTLPSTLGYLGGTSPDGLVTLGGSPGQAEIYVLLRSDMTVVRRTYSAPGSGQWRAHGLTMATEYTVVARDPSRTYKDMIEGAVTPIAYT
jgi:hypothetical protein